MKLGQNILNSTSITINSKVKKIELNDAPSSVGQLPVDILENNEEILVIAPLAGVDIDSAEIIINSDTLTIKGSREIDEELLGNNKSSFINECYWGKFSRSIILPADSDIQNIEATQKDHVLYIKIPKRMHIQMRIVKIRTK